MKSSKLFALLTMRHFPVCIAALWVFYTIYSEFAEIPVSLVALIEVVLGFAIIIAFSIRMQFCTIHHYLILYAFACTIAMWYEEYFGFGVYLSFAHWTAAIIGICLLSAICFKFINGNVCQEKKK